MVLRCRAGEEVQVTLENQLKPHLEPEPFAPAVPIDVPEGSRTVSQRVSLHADLVRTDIAHDDGSWVGRNPDSTVGPGETVTYHWLTDVELGPVPLYDLADVRNHRHHGLVGALIVEPADAIPILPDHRHEHCEQPQEAPFAHQAWTGVQAVIHTAAGNGESGQRQECSTERDEVVLVLQDGLRLFLDNNLAVPFPDIPADPGENGVDPEDQGQKAINYHSDPTGPTRWMYGRPTRAAHYQVPPDKHLLVHLVGGFDKPRNHSLNIHGFLWPAWPHRKDSPYIGAEGGLTVNTTRTLHLKTRPQEGDHAVRSGIVRYAVGEGLWAILTVSNNSTPSTGP